ncbi:hypothetical protein F0247_23225 [Vibrio crassostreae]|uniref:hypothetical protein n=1 Tax=Vibrio crassostreae TaxID=246167 RepID=UPI00148C62C0|nr:hypothetical protein [Vibrio crassostreae]NOH77928.1 hypothetical protein [Vibrio crassostreae]
MNIENWGFFGIVLLQLLLTGTGFYIASYLKSKGKNLASREDLGKLTLIVEKIKTEQAKQIEDIKQQHNLELQKLQQLNSLQLSALDERLKVAQEAYALVFEMLGCAGRSEQTIDVLKRATNFWETRSLYLSAEVREAFDKAIAATNAHESTLIENSPASPAGNRLKISSALRVIESSVLLPSFSSATEAEKS